MNHYYIIDPYDRLFLAEQMPDGSFYIIEEVDRISLKEFFIVRSIPVGVPKVQEKIGSRFEIMEMS